MSGVWPPALVAGDIALDKSGGWFRSKLWEHYAESPQLPFALCTLPDRSFALATPQKKKWKKDQQLGSPNIMSM